MSTPISSSIFPALPTRPTTIKTTSQQPLHFGMSQSTSGNSEDELSAQIKLHEEAEKPSKEFISAVTNFIKSHDSLLDLDKSLFQKFFNVLREKKNPYLMIAFVDALCQNSYYARFFQPYEGEYRLEEIASNTIAGLLGNYLPGKRFYDQLLITLKTDLLNGVTDPTIQQEVIKMLADKTYKTDFGKVSQTLKLGWPNYHLNEKDIPKPPVVEKSMDWLKPENT